MKILVVLPTLGDRLASLEETLETVAIQRRNANFTLAVVLPRRSEDARLLAKKFDAVIVDDPGTGLSGAINAGLAVRSDETHYAWIGDDDLFRPDGLQKLSQLMTDAPDAVVAFGGCDYIDVQGRVLATSAAGKFARMLLPWGPDLIPHPGSLIDLDSLNQVGNFDESLKFAMDLDVFLKLRSHGTFVSTREPVSAFRWHPDSLTVSNRLSSSKESEFVKRRHLPVAIRPFSYIWSVPLRWAAFWASNIINRKAIKLAEGSLD